ncbi:hypothetical protein RvY_10268 [Ramazzottius varieornatus]|uniref:Tc1-like transposase DDE domain-containing protein n=1 Tax=Ramazzottius varieornatus TaxID=947166 RepID=A0A1D1VC76_RAMVA|nr:hypothetical protein RvY_10268 [Ramazzottius varieornatus]
MQTLSRQTRATKPTSQVKMRDSFSCANKSENCTVVCSYRQEVGQGVGLGRKTLSNRLRDFKARRSKAVLDELTQEHRDNRVFWCLIQRELLLKNPTMFHEVIFSDEVRFNFHGGKIECWYLEGENRHDTDLQVPVATRIKGGIMLWGAITATGPVALIRVDGRINSDVYEDTLFERLLPFLDKHGRDLTFQQDKCPIHTSRKMRQFFWREGIEKGVVRD